MLLTVDVVTAERAALVVPEGSVFQVQNRRVRVSRRRRHRAPAADRGRRPALRRRRGAQRPDDGDAIVIEGIKLREGARVRYEAEAAISEARARKAPAPSSTADARS